MSQNTEKWKSQWKVERRCLYDLNNQSITTQLLTNNFQSTNQLTD